MGYRKRLDDKARQKLLLTALRNGASRRQAAKSIGVGKTTLWRYLQDHPSFRWKIEQAEAHCYRRLVEQFDLDSKGDWRASAWLLERLYPEDFGKRHPDHISPAQAAAAMEQIVAILVDEVPAEYHTRIYARMVALLEAIKDPKRHKFKTSSNGDR